jgi:predicted dehydrogenase
MSPGVITMAIAGVGGRGTQFARLAARLAPDVQVVAIADTDADRLAAIGDELAIAPAARFPGWQAMAEARLGVDAVVITTIDREHLGSSLAFLGQGCHVLLEKPMAATLADCKRIAAAQRASGRILSVCHPMRYQADLQAIKALIDGGAIGRMVSISLIEQVAFWHQAHSYVRGNAANTGRSAPMILTKSCHDLDWLCHLVGAPAERLSSFGSLSWFTAANAPAGAPPRCTDGCPHEKTCTYSALRCYVDTNRRAGWPAAMCSPSDHSREAHLRAVQTGPYGRCVWHCDNDVVDHQVVALEFSRGLTATFTMTGLTSGGGRRLRVHGTLGELSYAQGSGEAIVATFGVDEPRRHALPTAAGGHGGGDETLFAAFIAAIRSGDASGVTTSAAESLRSHAMAFAAEISRGERRQVELAELLS